MYRSRSRWSFFCQITAVDKQIADPNTMANEAFQKDEDIYQQDANGQFMLDAQGHRIMKDMTIKEVSDILSEKLLNLSKEKMVLLEELRAKSGQGNFKRDANTPDVYIRTAKEKELDVSQSVPAKKNSAAASPKVIPLCSKRSTRSSGKCSKNITNRNRKTKYRNKSYI